MKVTKVAGPSFAVLKATLDAGERILAEPGAMIAQRNLRMDTGMASGGFISGVRRLLAAESFFVNTFSAEQDGGEVHLAPSVPGDIQAHPLAPHEEIYLQAGAFLVCTDTISIDTKFQGLRGLFNREGLFFLRISTIGPDRSGEVFFHTYGAVIETTVRAGEDLIVDNGHLVAFTEGVDYTIDRVRGLKSLIAGGEGLVLRFTGAGKVWLQTRELPSLASALSPHLPERS